MPMFIAIGKDLNQWCNSLEICANFDEQTWKDITDAFYACWFGEGNHVGLCADQYVAAYLLDPMTTPDPTNRPTHWLQSVSKVLK